MVAAGELPVVGGVEDLPFSGLSWKQPLVHSLQVLREAETGHLEMLVNTGYKYHYCPAAPSSESSLLGTARPRGCSLTPQRWAQAPLHLQSQDFGLQALVFSFHSQELASRISCMFSCDEQVCPVTSGLVTGIRFWQARQPSDSRQGWSMHLHTDHPHHPRLPELKPSLERGPFCSPLRIRARRCSRADASACICHIWPSRPGSRPPPPR